MKRRVAIFGNYGVGNLGDELMLQIVMGALRRQGIDPVVFCGAPDVIRQEYGVEAHSFFAAGVRSFVQAGFSSRGRRQSAAARKALQSVEAVVFGGGGLFVDARPQAILLWWRQLRMCLALRKPVFLLSQNVSLERWYARKMLMPLMRRVEQIVVRDQASAAVFEGEGVVADVSPDITFLKPPVPLSEPVSDRPIVSVALCAGGMGDHQYEVLRSFLRPLQDRFDLRLLVFQNAHDDDRQVYERLGIAAPVVTGDEVFELLSQSSYVLGMRYHSLVFALQAGVPFLAFDYQPKVRGFVYDNVLQDWLVDLDEMSVSGLQEQFALLERQSPELRTWMRQQSRLLQADAERYLRFLSF